MSLSKLRELVKDREAWHYCSPWVCKELDMTEQLNNNLTIFCEIVVCGPRVDANSHQSGRCRKKYREMETGVVKMKSSLASFLYPRNQSKFPEYHGLFSVGLELECKFPDSAPEILFIFHKAPQRGDFHQRHCSV